GKALVKYLQKLFSCDKPTTTLLKSTKNIFKMKLSTTGIIFIVLLFTCMEVTNAAGNTLYRTFDGHQLGYGCYKGYCWAFCSDSWVDGKWCYTRQQGYHHGKMSCFSDSFCYDKVYGCVGACG
uniref:Uncharacterized protein n=1 Tax=Clytia hemisphaerica TaxID=252671 RepID=A0A7M5UFM5_9CNID